MSASNGKYVEEFSEHQQDVPVRIDGKDFVLREMSDDAFTKWGVETDRLRLRNKRDKKELMKEFRVLLIDYCLFDAGGSKVARDVIRSWGTSLKNKLFTRCQQLNGLTETVREEEEKNSDEEVEAGGASA